MATSLEKAIADFRRNRRKAVLSVITRCDWEWSADGNYAGNEGRYSITLPREARALADEIYRGLRKGANALILADNALPLNDPHVVRIHNGANHYTIDMEKDSFEQVKRGLIPEMEKLETYKAPLRPLKRQARKMEPGIMVVPEENPTIGKEAPAPISNPRRQTWERYVPEQGTDEVGYKQAARAFLKDCWEHRDELAAPALQRKPSVAVFVYPGPVNSPSWKLYTEIEYLLHTDAVGGKKGGVHTLVETAERPGETIYKMIIAEEALKKAKDYIGPYEQLVIKSPRAGVGKVA